MQYGVVIVDHGSRRAESNQMLEEVARLFAERFAQRYEIVEPAHMELCEPSIATAFTRCVERGAKRVVVCPFFLGPGKHWTGDIPRLAAEAAAQHPGTSYHVTMPLGIDDLMLQLLDKRVGSCVDHDFLCDNCRGSVRSGETLTAPTVAASNGSHGHAAHAPAASADPHVCSTCPYAKALSEGATMVPVGH
jgi:sirohydrochlorin ferrochelatase